MSKSKNVLTDVDHERIRELAAEGLGAKRIANALGRKPGTVNWFMYRDGIKGAARSPERRYTHVRNGVTIVRYTAEEDAYIEALRVQDFTCKQIAELASKRFGIRRTPHSIRVRLIMLAAREGAE